MLGETCDPIPPPHELSDPVIPTGTDGDGVPPVGVLNHVVLTHTKGKSHSNSHLVDLLRMCSSKGPTHYRPA